MEKADRNGWTGKHLPYSFYGNMGRLSAEGMDRRFFNRLGSSQLDRTICSTAGKVGYRYTMGAELGTDPEDTIHSKLIIFWGINAASTNMHQIALAKKARKNGAKSLSLMFTKIKPAVLRIGLFRFCQGLIVHSH